MTLRPLVNKRKRSGFKGEKIEQIVILITGEDGSRDTFIRNRNDYIEELHNTIEAFKLDKEQNG